MDSGDEGQRKVTLLKSPLFSLILSVCKDIDSGIILHCLLGLSLPF